jgi:hypothetical protein
LYVEPTTGIEPVNPILTKDVLYLLSYVGPGDFKDPSLTGIRRKRNLQLPYLMRRASCQDENGRLKSTPAVIGMSGSSSYGAGNGIRTRDPQLGRLTL